MTAAQLSQNLDLDLPFLDMRNLQGELKFDLTAKVNSSGKGSLKTRIDLKETQISIPGIGWHKSKSVETELRFLAHFSESGIEKIQSLEVIGGGLVLIGTGTLEKKNRYKLNLNILSIKDTVVSGKIIYDFNDSAKTMTKYDLTGHLSAKSLNEEFGLKFPLFDERYLSGKLKFNFTSVSNFDGKGSLTATINLKETRISFPGIGWQKSRMGEANLRLSAIFSELGIEEIKSVEVLGGGLTLAGTAKLVGTNYFEFKLAKFSFGETAVSGNVIYDGEKWQLVLTGPKIDLTKLLEGEEQNNRKYVRGPPLEIDLKIDKVKLSAGYYLSNVIAVLRNDGLVWSKIKLASHISLKKGGNNKSLKPDSKTS